MTRPPKSCTGLTCHVRLLPCRCPQGDNDQASARTTKLREEVAELEEVLEDLERRAVAQAQALERLPTELVRFEANIKALDTVRAGVCRLAVSVCRRITVAVRCDLQQLRLLDESFVKPVEEELAQAESILNDFQCVRCDCDCGVARLWLWLWHCVHLSICRCQETNHDSATATHSDTDKRLRDMTVRAHRSGTIPELQKSVHAYQEHHFALCERYNRDAPRLEKQRQATRKALRKYKRAQNALQAYERTYTPRPEWGGLLGDLPEVQATTVSPPNSSDEEDECVLQAVAAADDLYRRQLEAYDQQQAEAAAAKAQGLRLMKRRKPEPRPMSRVPTKKLLASKKIHAASPSKHSAKLTAGMDLADAEIAALARSHQRLLRSAPANASTSKLAASPRSGELVLVSADSGMADDDNASTRRPSDGKRDGDGDEEGNDDGSGEGGEGESASKVEPGSGQPSTMASPAPQFHVQSHTDLAESSAGSPAAGKKSPKKRRGQGRKLKSRRSNMKSGGSSGSAAGLVASATGVVRSRSRARARRKTRERSAKRSRSRRAGSSSPTKRRAPRGMKVDTAEAVSPPLEPRAAVPTPRPRQPAGPGMPNHAASGGEGAESSPVRASSRLSSRSGVSRRSSRRSNSRASARAASRARSRSRQRSSRARSRRRRGRRRRRRGSHSSGSSGGSRSTVNSHRSRSSRGSSGSDSGSWLSGRDSWASGPDSRPWSPSSDPTGRAGLNRVSVRRMRATALIGWDMAKAVDTRRIREAIQVELDAALLVRRGSNHAQEACTSVGVTHGCAAWCAAG